MAKTTKTQYCYTLKTAVKTPDIEDPATISDKLEADNVLDAFDDAIVILEAINSRGQGNYYLQCFYKYED